MKFNNNNNNNQITLIVFTILICFALDKCVAHSFADKAAPKAAPNLETKSTSNGANPPKTSNLDNQFSLPPSQSLKTKPTSNKANPPKTSTFENQFSFPPSESPEVAQNPTSGDDSFGPSSSFSGAFTDILKGSLNDDSSITMPPKGSSNAKYNKNSVVEQICSHTHYPDICLVTVQPLLNHKSMKIDTKVVLQVFIKATVRQVKLTIDKVEKHAAKSPELANELAECKEKYSNTLKNLKSAIDCIPSQDFGKLTVMLSTVMADVATCESKFEDLKSSSSMSKTHGLVSIMVNNCLSIASLVHH